MFRVWDKCRALIRAEAAHMRARGDGCCFPSDATRDGLFHVKQVGWTGAEQVKGMGRMVAPVSSGLGGGASAGRLALVVLKFGTKQQACSPCSCPARSVVYEYLSSSILADGVRWLTSSRNRRRTNKCPFLVSAGSGCLAGSRAVSRLLRSACFAGLLPWSLP